MIFLKQIILYSRDPQITAKFITSLLDLEDYELESSQGSGIFIKSASWSFFILKAKAEHLLSLQEVRDMEINFQVETREMLDDLLHKLQFFHYRQNDNSPTDIPKMSQQEDQVFFKAIDPDGRSWVFSHDNKTQ